jgi:hypothetical protein
VKAQSVRKTSDWSFAPVSLLVLAMLLFGWTHRHAFQMTGFAEDMGLVQTLSTAAEDGRIGQEVLPRWLGPLWGPGSTMWRPWAFTSLALDAKIFGANSGLWHVANLLLHLVAAIFTALLARAWLRSSWSAAAAFATMLLHPWTSESTLWLVGRFDGWVTAAVTAALYTSWRCTGIDRWWVATVLASALAYLSKESALILLPATALLLACRAYAQSTQRRERTVFAGFIKNMLPLLGAQLVLAAAYFLLRWFMVGAISTNVYDSHPVIDAFDLSARVGAHLQAFVSLGSASRFAATCVTLLFALSGVAAIIQGRWQIISFGVTWVAIVFLGAALHFRGLVGAGDGYRLYYLALVGIALIVAAGLTNQSESRPRLTTILLVTWCASLAVWQNATNSVWWKAAKEINDTATAIGKVLPTLAPADYSLVLLPDPIGAVPAFRNAQGAIVRAAPRRSIGTENTDYMVAFLPMQLNEWYQSMQKDIVRMITKRVDAPPKPTRFYCKEPGSPDLRYLGFWEAGTLEEWRAKWQIATRAACPNLKL